MLRLLWLVPTVPFASAALLAIGGGRMPVRRVAAIGVGAIGLSAVLSFLVAGAFWSGAALHAPYRQVLWTWIAVGAFRPQIAFYLDALSVVMMVVVTFVSFFVHLYSTEFMRGYDGYSRYFAYMNLFVAAMLTLVLADNLLLLYLGWEGVGLCSYLLIGFWYQDTVNGRAGRKAFIVTRVGDTAMAVGLFLLFHALGTLRLSDMLARAQLQWSVGAPAAIAAAALLLGGAVGKSAQLPLQTWLPDAMAGPTPTSALIHAATMVTAGVYLIARTHVLFALAPPVQFAVALIGAATLLLAGCGALVQSDIKRVLAYSTMSQIGYMFLALGVGAWGAAIFHFMTHAFFKSLLFLSAGVIIEALHHEHDIFRMGGLRKELPLAFWTFLIAGSSLAGLPLITAGYYSKDLILAGVGSSPVGSFALWGAGMVGVVLTALYIFRVIFLVFWGPCGTAVGKRPGRAMQLPLYVLAALSLIAGYGRHGFVGFVATALPGQPQVSRGLGEGISSAVGALAFLCGFLLALLAYQYRPAVANGLAANPVGGALRRFWFSGWGFDWLYQHLLVAPVMWAVRVNRADMVDAIYSALASFVVSCHRVLRSTETGNLRWYAAWIAGGSVVFLAIVLWL